MNNIFNAFCSPGGSCLTAVNNAKVLYLGSISTSIIARLLAEGETITEAVMWIVSSMLSAVQVWVVWLH